MRTALAHDRDTRRRVKILSLLVAGLALSGCSVTQLKDQTVSVGRSAGAIYTSQVLENLYQLAEDHNAVPSHFLFVKGSISTANSIAPTVTIPLGNQVTRGFVTSGGPFGVTGVEAPNQGLSLGASETWTQSWDITPEQNPQALTTLQIVYSYVLGIINDKDAGFQRLIAGSPAPAPAKKLNRSASVHCNLRSKGINCSVYQANAPPEAQDNSQPSTSSDVNWITQIHDKCGPDGGCFQKSGARCIPPEEANHRDAKDSDYQWICLGKYASPAERLLNHEIIISKDAYFGNVLFSLVMLSLQLQSEAAKAAASPPKTGA